MIYKFILGVLLVALGSFLGYLFGKKYRKRKQFFAQFCQFNDCFLAEITYARRPLSQFLTSASYRGEFALLIDDYMQNLEQASAFVELLQKDSEYSFLKSEDKGWIADYFYMLGRGDSQSQKSYFQSQKERIESSRTAAEKEDKRYADLYIKLGFLCGLFILILIL